MDVRGIKGDGVGGGEVTIRRVNDYGNPIFQLITCRPASCPPVTSRV